MERPADDDGLDGLDGEFDDPLAAPLPAQPATARQRARRLATASLRLPARLWSRLDMPLRARLLAVLLRPLGTLATVALAAGAFASLRRDGVLRVALDDAARISAAQFAELVQFVDQVSPQAIGQAAQLVLQERQGATAAAVLLAVWVLRRHGQRRPAADDPDT